MLFESTSKELAEQAKQSGMINRTASLKSLLDESAKWKPRGYDRAVKRARDYYQGRQINYLRNVLAERYPNSYQRMSPYVIPLFRHLVDQQATIYRSPPTREIAIGNEVDQEATDSIAKVYRDALADTRLLKVEQIAAASKLAFLRVGFDPWDSKIVLIPRWPDTVNVIFHPDWPYNLQRALCLVAEISSLEGVSDYTNDKSRYEIWTRTDLGWYMQVAISDGSGIEPIESEPSEFHSLLPWIAVPYEGLSEATLFQLPPQDDIAIQDSINAMATDLLWGISLQAWPQLWISGAADQKLVMGPGTALDLGESGQAGTLNFSPQIASITATIEDLIKRHLVLNSVSPATATADPAYLSGVSIKVQNSSMVEKRSERIPIYRETETRDLFPIMRMILEESGDNSIPPDSELYWQAGDVTLPIDDEAELRLAQGRVANSISTWPQEMVRLRISPDITTARRQYESNFAYNEGRPVTAGIPFIKSAEVAPKVIVEEGEDTGEDG